MATKSLGRLTVDMVLETAGFESGMDKAQRVADQKTRRMEQDARARAKAIETAFADIAAGITGAFAGLQIAQFANQTIQLQGRLDDLSKSTELSAENLAGLEHAARLSGTNLDTVATAVNKLSVNMGKDADKFARLGVTAKEPIAAFAQLADILRGIEDPQKRAAVASEALGKSWQELAPLLSEGGRGIQALIEEGKALSGVTDENNKAAADFGDNLEKLKTGSYGLANTIMNPLLPALNDLISKFNEAAKARNIFGWAITGGDEEDNAAERLGEITAQLYRLRKTRDELSAPTFANKLNDLVFGDVHDLNVQISALEKKAQYLQLLVTQKAKGMGDTPPVVATSAGAVSGFLAGSDKTTTARTISEGQRLVDQLQNRLMAAQKLSEVERLEAEIAAGRYKDATPAERAIALSLAQQIDHRAEIARQLDDEIAAAQKLSQAHEAEANRLAQLVAQTPYGQNLQKMQDEALAESALLSGKIDTGVYDQIIAKLHEVKDEGKDAFAELQQAIEGFGRDSAAAIVDFMSGAETNIRSTVASMLKEIAKILVYQNITKPIANWVGGLFNSTTTTASANGNVFSGSPGLHQYVNTVQTSPKFFAFDRLHGFARGGVFAEDGPEAVMPLARDNQGRLGVRSQTSASNVSISINVDAQSGNTQTKTNGDPNAWTQMANRLRQVVIEELNTQKRYGGVLYGART